MTQTTDSTNDIPLMNGDASVGLAPGEAAYLLDGAHYVAVSAEIKRDPINSILTCFCRARALEKDGTQAVDGYREPIDTRYSRTLTADQINDDTIGGYSGFVRAAVLVILGCQEGGTVNGTTLQEADIIAHVPDNIRYCIEAAYNAGPSGIVTIPEL